MPRLLFAAWLATLASGCASNPGFDEMEVFVISLSKSKPPPVIKYASTIHKTKVCGTIKNPLNVLLKKAQEQVKSDYLFEVKYKTTPGWGDYCHYLSFKA